MIKKFERKSEEDRVFQRKLDIEADRKLKSTIQRKFLTEEKSSIVRLTRNERMTNSPGKKKIQRENQDEERKLFSNRKENSTKKKRKLSQEKQKGEINSCRSNHQRTIWDITTLY